MRLLPESAGWVAYVWLVYLLNLPVVLLFMGNATAADWLWMGVAIALFLPLYFLAYWLRGRKLLVVMAAVVLLAIVMIPRSPGANVFFIYAAAMAGFVGRPRQSGLAVCAVVLALLADAAFAWLVLEWSLPELLYVYLPALVFSPIIGAVNVFHAERARQNARLRRAHEEVENLAKIAERERIARDLHDLLGHTLSMITLKSELASRLAEDDPTRAATEMRQVEEISRKALAEVRQVVRGYRSTGFGAELATARGALASADIAADVRIEPVDLVPAHESVLALALREAVTNVIRHAHATRCEVRLFRDGAGTHLEVEDDGRGGKHLEGSGLQGMRERLEAVGGRVRVSGGGGTTVRITLPAAASLEPSARSVPPATLRPDPA